jgi:tripartite-type tricarboxylate transporter receptor subunit TctC
MNGQQVIVDNRRGLRTSARAGLTAPDGYTMVIANTGMLTSERIQKEAPYDPFNDFTPITNGRRAVVSADPPFRASENCAS